MSDYLFLCNVGSGIRNHISLTNFAPNHIGQTPKEKNFKCAVFKQNFQSTKWKKIDEKYFSSHNLSFSSDEYSLDIGELAVIVPVSIEDNLKAEYDELPIPISRKIDLSPVNERASITFSIHDFHSSYQGDFPYSMSRIHGTFLSFDPLIQNRRCNQKLVFVNIHSKKIDNKRNLKIFTAAIDKNKILATKEFVNNSVAIFDFEGITDRDLCFYSRDALGIPIFISFNEKEFISVEHTHPPSELFWENKMFGQGLIKKNWLNKLP